MVGFTLHGLHGCWNCVEIASTVVTKIANWKNSAFFQESNLVNQVKQL